MRISLVNSGYSGGLLGWIKKDEAGIGDQPIEKIPARTILFALIPQQNWVFRQNLKICRNFDF